MRMWAFSLMDQGCRREAAGLTAALLATDEVSRPDHPSSLYDSWSCLSFPCMLLLTRSPVVLYSGQTSRIFVSGCQVYVQTKTQCKSTFQDELLVGLLVDCLAAMQS
jgi:hypothetical protein